MSLICQFVSRTDPFLLHKVLEIGPAPITALVEDFVDQFRLLDRGLCPTELTIRGSCLYHKLFFWQSCAFYCSHDGILVRDYLLND